MVSPKMIAQLYHADVKALSMVAAAIKAVTLPRTPAFCETKDVESMLVAGIEEDIVI